MNQAQGMGGHSLTYKIVAGLLAGLVVGLALNWTLDPAGNVYGLVVDGLLRVIGAIFVASLQMLVVPLVFVSLVCGTSALKEPARLGRLGVKALALYLATTALAVSFALVLAVLVQPGAGVQLDGAEFEPATAPPMLDVLIGMVPKNPFEAMATGNMLQIIVFSILFGLAITLTGGSAGERIRSLFESFNAVIMRLVAILMAVAPYGVFALIARVAASLGADVFQNLLVYFFLVLGALLFHLLVTYPTILALMARLNPLVFLRKMRPAMLFAFSTASSNATLPVTLRTVEHRLGVRNSVASFTIPLGATINMDGTAIMQGVATVFIANAYGVDLTLAQLVTVVVMATMASIGTAGVPGVGLIMLAGVLQQVGLPVQAIGLVLGVDRLLDMVRTAVNITGDATVACVVARSENEFDADVFDDPHAGESGERKADELIPG